MKVTAADFAPGSGAVVSFDSRVQDQACVLQKPRHECMVFWNTPFDPGLQAQLQASEQAADQHHADLREAVRL